MATPRRTLTAEEKRARDDQYRVEPKQFGEVLKGIVTIFNSLVTLNSALGKAGKGAQLVWAGQAPGQFVHFNRRHMRSANSRFARTILDLKNYLRVSRKKVRDPVRPESFSGTYTPVYAGEALQAFFNSRPENFGSVNPAVAGSPSLMNSLDMAKQGYLLRNTSTMLFYIYAHAQQLQDPANAQFARSDAVMDAAFGGNILAAFYPLKDANGSKITMANAVAQGLTPGLNTYQAIQQTRADFNPARFNTYFYQNIAASNYYSRAVLAADPALAPAAGALQQADIRAAMLAEHNLVKETSAHWHDLLEPGRKVQRDARKKTADAAKRAAGGVAARGRTRR